MARRPRITFSESAVADIEALIAWYDSQGVPEVGRRFSSEILSRIEILKDHRDVGRMVPEFEQPFLRELIHSPFRIIYRRDGDCIQVIRIWRSERLLSDALE